MRPVIDLDEHLRAALRHAPDCDALPPPALSEAILRAGRHAVGKPRRRSSTWAWLWGLGGLGGALAAGWFGLMVWDGAPLGGGMPPLVVARNETPSAKAESRVPAPAAPQPAGEAGTTMAGPDTLPPQRSAAETPVTADPTPAAAPPPVQDAATPATPAAQREARAEPAPARDSDATTAVDPAAPGETASTAAAAGPASAAAPGVAPPAAQPTERADAVASAAASAPPESARVAAAAPPFAAPRDRLSARADEAEALKLTRPEQLRTRIVDEAHRWQWQALGSAAPRPVDAAAQAWLERLIASAGGRRWEPHLGALPDGPSVTWLRNGKLEVEIRVTESGVLWRAAGSPAVSMPLEPQALQALTRRF